MDKKYKFIIAGVSIAALLGGYLYGKSASKSSVATGAGVAAASDASNPNFLSGFKKYAVTTGTSSLNIRKTPSTEGEIIGTLPKGTVIYATPSATIGWSEYSANGISVDGYVSSQYLT